MNSVIRFPFLVALMVVHAAQSYGGSTSSSNVSPSPSPSVRVRVAENVGSLVIRGYDIQVLQKGPSDSESIRVASADQSTEWLVTCSPDQIVLYPKYSRRQKLPKKLVVHAPVSFQTPVGFISLGMTQFRESLSVYPVKNGCDVINKVDLEKYLDGLVNTEFSSKWNSESISAQVVAARSYAYFQILEARKNPQSYFDLDATTKDQVYGGSMKEDFQASSIVQLTRGKILALENTQGARPLKAFYHSTCGGKTELPENVWGHVAGKFESVVCPYCTASPRFNWTLDLTKHELQSLLLKGAKGYTTQSAGVLEGWSENWQKVLKDGSLLDLRIGALTPQNRVPKVTAVVTYSQGLYELPVRAALFREWLGPARLRSTSFQVYTNSRENLYHFSGTGNGHGVGMCQWGAKVMGEKGKKMAEILKLYYPNAVLRQMW